MGIRVIETNTTSERYPYMCFELFKHYEKHGCYGSTTKRKLLSLDKFRQWVSATAKKEDLDDIAATVSTRLWKPRSKGIFGWLSYGFQRCQHILTLDCDSIDDMYAATRVLKRDGIDWAGIESSPGRFWIVTDKMGLFQDMYDILEAIPGVDKNYITATKTWDCFYLRAIRRENSKPEFGPSDNLKNPIIKDWYERFQQLHDDPIILENLNLICNLKNGTMSGIAANPDFEV